MLLSGIRVGYDVATETDCVVLEDAAAAAVAVGAPTWTDNRRLLPLNGEECHT